METAQSEEQGTESENHSNTTLVQATQLATPIREEQGVALCTILGMANKEDSQIAWDKSLRICELRE